MSDDIRNTQSGLPLIGYDERGVVFDMGDHVMRRVFDEHYEKGLATYTLFRECNFREYDIVETELGDALGSFRHKKHIISHPHEWTASMHVDRFRMKEDLL